LFLFNIKKFKQLLNKKNKILFEKGLELIDTKFKCKEYAKLFNIVLHAQNNWIKFSLGNSLFDKLKIRYYQLIEEFDKACETLELLTVNDYKNNYHKDTKLPPYDYILDGFYYDMEPHFNLSTHLSQNVIEVF
jgi:hypothetical protein